MNKKAYYTMLFTLSFLIVSCVVYIGFHFILSDIETQRINNNEYERFKVNGSGYSIVIEEDVSKLNLLKTSIGVDVYLEVEENNSEWLAKYYTTIDMPRKTFSEQNYKVKNEDEYIILELFDKNGNLEQKYRFYYEDIVEDKGRMQ